MAHPLPTLVAHFAAIRDYDWDNDREFQAGLRSILNKSSQIQALDVIERAKCFYYKRKTGVEVDAEDYKHWNNSLDNTQSGPAFAHVNDTPQKTSTSGEIRTLQSSKDAPYPKSFSEIAELVASGKPIPGIKLVPDIVNETPLGRGSQPERRKPWEHIQGSLTVEAPQ